ncbi:MULTISPECIES: hydrogenase expression/formation protein HypE [Clostridium]|uniref:hydrogenase expression/formation protein HypE n=1 Tax=Clostridium TaxID=1485 RepID=UPI00069D32EE|nr:MULTISPECIES: hydrogenase expression/formation protein HypE [Clostridium]KOF58206.1 carbamoyl dehydratase HypE [Clostridium sp. DMHC 10]MCD2345575.1 hydrogenase expression/formation protein HypE [Clostridium guangxiense]
MNKTIKLFHGDGGKYTSELIENIFYKHFNNSILTSGIDSALFNVNSGKMAFTTDSFVVKPLFFSGGNIGKLAVCGTINDLSVSGAKPLYLSAGFIIEEGFSIEILDLIVEEMAKQCKLLGVKVVTGDTKVVEKGSADRIFINTAGVGVIQNNYEMKKIEAGDKIIVSGNIGDHGTAITLERYGVDVKSNIKSDCASVYEIVEAIKEYYPFVKIMKDPTRGGIATILNEISSISGLGIKLVEENIPILREVQGVNKMLGLDPLYMACEGRVIIVAKSEVAKEILGRLRSLKQCKDASIIGSFTEDSERIVYVENSFGGERILNTLDGEMLPRIC